MTNDPHGNDRFQTILDSGPGPFVSIDGQGCILDWSRQAEITFGWRKEEVAGKSLAEVLLPSSHRDLLRHDLKQYGNSGEPELLGKRVEVNVLRRNGDEIPVELSLVAAEHQGAPIFSAYFRQIQEESLYRDRMAALVDGSYDAIISKDLEGRITSWNTGAERVYGYRKQEAIGKTISLILPPQAKAEEAEIRHAMQTGQRLEQFEAVRRRKDGRTIPVSVTVSPITDRNGQIIGSSTIERDVTDAKRNEEELRKAKNLAENANQARSEFLANVSHELRTPMNAIIGMTQIALGEELSDHVRDCVKTANESAHSLLTLLNDILDFSKLESGKFTIENEPFLLRETIEETVNSLSPRAFEKGLELACDVSSDVPNELMGDPIRLRQVLTNLVSNALKFTTRGEVVVQIKPIQNWPSETRLRFSVTDTGVGISEEDQKRILEPFTQVDSSSTRQQGGTGLGLSICGELLRLMGGRLSVESAPDKGSKFSFNLSFLRQHERDRRAVDPTPLDHLKHMPVLVVDDNSTNRRILSQTLANWSMKPETARDAEEAMRKLADSRRNFPLVIVDALMPGTDGYELSKRIGEQAPDAPPVVLMVSSADRLEFKDRERQAHVAASVAKPVSQSDLLDAMMRALNVQPLLSAKDVRPKSGPVAPRSVLLAEDTPANQKVVLSVLRKRGHEVTVAQNGREAIEVCRNRHFDVVLMDVQMPTLDGFQATAAIREQQKKDGVSTPIIAMTAHAMRGDRERCLQAGMDAYIAKPIDVDELVNLVESVGGRERERRPAQTAAAKSNGVMDFESALKRLAGDMSLFLDFVGYFDEDYPQLLSDLEKAVDNEDAPLVERTAHSLKGLAANFSAQSCSDAASEMEQMGRSQKLDGASEALARLKDELSRLDAALEEHRS